MIDTDTSVSVGTWNEIERRAERDERLALETGLEPAIRRMKYATTQVSTLVRAEVDLAKDEFTG